MKSMITFRHMKASDAIKKYVMEKMEKLEKYSRKNMEAHVVLSAENKTRQNAELIVSSKGIRAQGTASSSDMYASIDEAIEKVAKTLRRHHDKKVKEKTHRKTDVLA